MNDRPIRFGIVAASGIADVAHAPAIRRVGGATLWSVLSRDKERAERFAKKHGAAAPHPAHSDLSEFLKDPQLQAVVITSPDKLHAHHIMECARAGKHVLVEKPMVMSREEGMEVIEVCKRNRVKLGVAMHLRWHAGHRKLHALVSRENRIGALRHIRIQWAFQERDSSNWRASDELARWWSLAAVGPHCFDLLDWFANDGSRVVESRRSLINRSIWGGAHDETAMATLRYSDGLTADITTSVVFNSPSRLELYGDNGYAICEGTFGQHGKGSLVLNGHALEFTPDIPFDGEIRDFAAAIRENREPEVTGMAGLHVVDHILEVVGRE